MPDQRIDINTATVEELQTLRGIGPRLAERIVEHRTVYGELRGPDDLAQIRGIPLNLADSLGAAIVWPGDTQPVPPWERSPIVAIMCLLILLPLTWQVTDVVIPDFQFGLESHQNGISGSWIILWVDFFKAIQFISLGLFFAVSAWMFVVPPSILSRGFQRARLSAILAALVSFLIHVLGHVAHYQLYAVTGWSEIKERPDHLLEMVGAVMLVTLSLAILVILNQPDGSKAELAFRAGDLALFLVSVTSIGMVWIQKDNWPIFMLAINGLYGLFTSVFSVIAIRTGQSLTGAILYFLDLPSMAHQVVKRTEWDNWIDARLADPRQQEDLKQALMRRYPPSRSRTLFNFLVLGAGIWLIVTTLEAIIGVFVEDWVRSFWD